MKERTIEYFRERVAGLTGGQVLFKETVPVPDEWWMGSRRPDSPAITLEVSHVHVFSIRRGHEEIYHRSAPIRWMGDDGLAYVWSYKLKGRWYYTRIFHRSIEHPEIKSPEDAVRANARRPWLSWQVDHPDNRRNK